MRTPIREQRKILHRGPLERDQIGNGTVRDDAEPTTAKLRRTPRCSPPVFTRALWPAIDIAPLRPNRF